jgi:hypothetical protein
MKQYDVMYDTLQEFNTMFDITHGGSMYIKRTDINLLAECFMMVGDVQAAVNILARSVQLRGYDILDPTLWRLGVIVYNQISK